METINSVPTQCPECGEDWEFGCTTEKHDDGTVIFQCWGCGRDFLYCPTKGATITPQQRRQLKKGLAERTKVRRRKEDRRRQHIYK